MEKVFFPKLVEYHGNNILIAQIVVDSLDLNSDISDELFDIRTMRDELNSTVSSSYREYDFSGVNNSIQSMWDIFNNN